MRIVAAGWTAIFCAGPLGGAGRAKPRGNTPLPGDLAPPPLAGPGSRGRTLHRHAVGPRSPLHRPARRGRALRNPAGPRQ
jgi:hypothetical protein